MDKIHFPYRSESHLPFLYVVGESGSWDKHGLQVEYDYFISSEDAHNNVANGSVEFVGGNHLSPYIRRPKGDRWVYLGQKCQPAEPPNDCALRFGYLKGFGFKRAKGLPAKANIRDSTPGFF